MALPSVLKENLIQKTKDRYSRQDTARLYPDECYDKMLLWREASMKGF